MTTDEFLIEENEQKETPGTESGKKLSIIQSKINDPLFDERDNPGFIFEGKPFDSFESFIESINNEIKRTNSGVASKTKIKIEENSEGKYKLSLIYPDSTSNENPAIKKIIKKIETKYHIDFSKKEESEVEGFLFSKKSYLSKIETFFNQRIFEELKLEEERKKKRKSKIGKKIKSVEKILAFKELASIILTEPYMYTNSKEEAEAELRRIRSEFEGIEVVPCFYHFLETKLVPGSHLAEKLSNNDEISKSSIRQIIEFGGGVAGTGGLGASAIAIAIGGSAFVAIGAIVVGAGAIYLLAGDAIEDIVGDNEGAKLQLDRISQALLNCGRNLTNKIPENYLEEIKKIHKRVYDPNNLEALVNQIGDSSKISTAIKTLTYSFISKDPVIDMFDSVGLNTQTKSALSGVLSPSLRAKVESETAGKAISAIFYDDLIGGESRKYYDYLLTMPTESVSFFKNETNAEDLFFIGKQWTTGKSGLFFLDKENLYFQSEEPLDYETFEKSKVFLITEQAKDYFNAGTDEYFERNKSYIAQQQAKKIGLLKAIKDALFEDFAIENIEEIQNINPKLAEQIDKKSVFELMNQTAYPDIIMPFKPIFLEENPLSNFYHPSFYYFDSRFTKGNKEKEKRIQRRILNKSIEFKNKMKESPFYGGYQREFPIEDFSINDDRIAISFEEEIVKQNLFQDISLTTNVDSENEQSNVQLNPSIQINRVESNSDKIEKLLKQKREEYKNNLEEAEKLKSIFGNKYGFLNESSTLEKLKTTNFENDDVKKLLSKLNISPPKNDLEKLEEDCKDIYESFSKYSGMKGAFPTFRLYIVEEDEIYSDKLIAYDDFHNYNSVVSFSVQSDYELAASVASIQLQNISGILDGTKKLVMRDIDVNDRNVKSDEDDAAHKNIESIVLRPGINIQLRAGYETNTNDLDILISGRVTEVNYSSDNMLCNLTVQSYGQELESIIKKNLAKNNKENVFYSTHQLLGSLALSEELKHFGRIKKGKIFTKLEEKSPSLDEEEYTNGSILNFNYTYGWGDWINDHSLAIGLTALLGGSIIRGGVRLLGKVSGLRTAGIATSKFFNKAGNFIKDIDDAWIKSFNIAGTGGLGKLGEILKSIPYWMTFGLAKGTGRAVGKINRVFFGGSTKAPNVTVINGIDTSTDDFAKLVGAYNNGGVKALTAAQRSELKRVVKLFAAARKAGKTGTIKTFKVYANQIVQQEYGSLARIITSGEAVFGKAGVLGVLGLSNGFGGFIKTTWGGIKNIFRVGTGVALLKVGSTLLGTLLEGVYETVTNSLIAAFDSFVNFFKTKKSTKRKILLSPQDDNLFCPNPRTYLKNFDEKSIWNDLFYVGKTQIRNAAKYTVEILEDTTLGLLNWGVKITGLSVFDSREYNEDTIKLREALFDKRLDVNYKENNYILSSKTIWQVFKEMELRHPGYNAGVRPYGNTLEYRIYFGPNFQKYWSSDSTLLENVKINKILEDIKENKGSITENTIRSFYPKAKERLSSLGINSDDTTILNSFVINDLLKKINKRTRPFRKVFLASSNSNLVQNGIISSEHDMITKAVIHYKKRGYSGDTSGIASDMNSLEIVANNNIPNELLRAKEVRYDNIIGSASAIRYGTGELLKGVSEMYQGNVLILGNPKIFPKDYIVLEDNILKMYGPVEVKAVTHMFNHQSGFLTNLEIRAITTFGNDSTTYPVLQNALFKEAQESLYEKFSNSNQIQNPETLNSSIKDAIEDSLENIDEVLFGTALPRESKNKLISYLTKELTKEYEQALSQGRPLFVGDVFNSEIDLSDIITQPIQDIGTSIGVGGAGIGGLSILFDKLRGGNPGLLRLTKSRNGLAALTAIISGAIIYLEADKITNGVEASLSSGKIGKNLLRPTLLTHLGNGALIEVYPLMKNGIPILRGGLEQSSESNMIYQQLGNIFSGASEGYEGYLKKLELIKSGGETAEFLEEEELEFTRLSEEQEIPESTYKEIINSDFTGSLGRVFSYIRKVGD